MQAIFDPMTVNTGPAPHLTTEFGAGLAITITAIVVCTRYRAPGMPGS